MKLLAIETSTVACSVAVLCDGRIFEQHAARAREHTRLAGPMIEASLADAGLELKALDSLVLGRGPGSFIGLRIASSLVQGLAYGAGLRVVSVSSMLAVAEEVLVDDAVDEVIVAQDAHMNEVYLGRYARRDGIVVPLVAERLQSVSRIEELDGVSRLAAGHGWARYPALLEANRPMIDRVSDVFYPRARHLLPAAVREVEAGRLFDPVDAEPSYLRHEVATPPRSADARSSEESGE